jgi:hypothetical protein
LGDFTVESNRWLGIIHFKPVCGFTEADRLEDVPVELEANTRICFREAAVEDKGWIFKSS